MSTLLPLTHHEILSLAEPFVRRGHRVDLASSDRAARRLCFAPRAVAGTGDQPPWVQTLRLSAATKGHAWRLERTVADAGGLEATLGAEGDDPGRLLALVEAVPVHDQWLHPEGVPVALDQQVDHPRGSAQPRLLLRRARARVVGLTLDLRVSGVAGYPAEFQLLVQAPGAPALPHDFFAVRGGAWSRLARLRQGWEGSVRLRGEEPRRSAEARARVAEAVGHIARTLSESPVRFHEVHRLARWRLALADALPWLALLAILGVALGVQRLAPERQSVLALLANLAPPLLMGLFFLRREMPRLGLPRPPGRLAADAWQVQPPTDAPREGS